MNLEKNIRGWVKGSEAGQYLAPAAADAVATAVVEGLKGLGPEGIALFAKLVLGADTASAPAATRKRRATRTTPTSKSKEATNKAKGAGARLRGAINRTLKGVAKAGDDKIIADAGAKSVQFADRLAETPAQKAMITKIVNGTGAPSGFPATES